MQVLSIIRPKIIGVGIEANRLIKNSARPWASDLSLGSIALHCKKKRGKNQMIRKQMDENSTHLNSTKIVPILPVDVNKLTNSPMNENMMKS